MGTDINKAYHTAIACVYDMKPQTFYSIISQYPTRDELLAALKKDSSFVILSNEQKRQLELFVRRDEEVLKRIHNHRVETVTFEMEGYPAGLKEMFDPPAVLFCKGRTELLKSPDCLSVIGSREPTRNGVEITRKIVKDIAQKGIVVVSGMARGIDGEANRAALEVGGDTIAVLGSGIDMPYPPENTELYDDLTENGLVISEYGIGVDSEPFHFPARNRIISGLSRGVLVVEAGERSGTSITVGYANEQGRDVFAVPNSPLTVKARGSNRLLCQGAAVVCEANDILSFYSDWEDRMYPEIKKEPVPTLQLDFNEKRIVEVLYQGNATYDELVEKTGISAKEMGGLLTKLTLRGIVSQAAGNMYSVE